LKCLEIAENSYLIDVDSNFVTLHQYNTRCGIFL